jgi:hypothetical protein
VIWATVLAGVVDIGVAWLLIAKHGAVGACIGSGAAQLTAVGMMWVVGIRLYGIKLPWVQIGKITAVSIAAAIVARLVGAPLRPVWAIVMGGSASLVTLLVLFYLLRVLEPEDRARFSVLSGMLPKAMRPPVDRIIYILVRPEVGSATPSNV